VGSVGAVAARLQAGVESRKQCDESGTFQPRATGGALQERTREIADSGSGRSVCRRAVRREPGAGRRGRREAEEEARLRRHRRRDQGRDVIKAITITGGKKDAPVVHCVVLDENGKKVAELNGKRVRAVGTIEEKEGSKWITVQTCTEIVPKPKDK